MSGVRPPEEEIWLTQQREIHEAEIESVPFAKVRYDICKECEHHIKHIMVCKICSCFLPGKTRLKGAECPAGKWGSLIEK